MDKVFITLTKTPQTKTPQKTENFLRLNNHVQGISTYFGINGKDYQRSFFLKHGIIEKGCKWTLGAIGCSVSHAILWNHAIKSNKPLRIFESDAYLCKNFIEQSNRLLSSLPTDWDIILWGFNTNSMLRVKIPPNISNISLTCDDHLIKDTLSSFRFKDIHSIALPLLQTFGLCGYAISPTGARKFLKHTVPFRNTLIRYTYPSGTRQIEAAGIDTMLNQVYPSTKAYISFPPLCLTSHIKEQSDTLH